MCIYIYIYIYIYIAHAARTAVHYVPKPGNVMLTPGRVLLLC